MQTRAGKTFLFLALAMMTALIWGCSKQSEDASSCSPSLPPTNQITGSTGTAVVFVPDPRMAANDPNLDPKSDLDPYRTQVELSRLDGTGVLRGQYVDVRTNEGSCDEQYGAMANDNHFEYSHADAHFQEAMAYYYGDTYQAALEDAGVKVASTPVHLVAHCIQKDNAYYEVIRRSDGSTEEQVCLGDSTVTKGASYGDDAYVTVHEMQHAMTMRHYSLTSWLGEFKYDEAGSLNEGISDFMALMYLSPLVPRGFNPEVFSSWALGSFLKTEKLTRGATTCPMYDPSFANGCSQLSSCNGSGDDSGVCPNFIPGQGHVSYVYPDGLNWPYADNYYSIPTVDVLSIAFLGVGEPEEIHSQAIIVEGALWDIYSELLSNHGGDQQSTQKLMMRLVAKTVEDLPKPDSLNLSPVTFREFGLLMNQLAHALKFSTQDLATISAKLDLRGLAGGSAGEKALDSTWASVGLGYQTSFSPGSLTPGIRINDNGSVLRAWLQGRGQDASVVQQANGNQKLDPGETAVIWFDLQNNAAVTAGGVNLTVTSLDPDVSFISGANPGWISNSRVQIQYSKINGTGIVGSISQSAGAGGVRTSNTYFESVPEYMYAPVQTIDLSTGVWLKVASSASHGKVVSFQVDAKPSNGQVSTVQFNATIQ